MISPGTLFRGVLDHLTLSFTFLTHHLTTLLGRGGQLCFYQQILQELHVQIGKELILTVRLARAVLLENSLHEITAKL